MDMTDTIVPRSDQMNAEDLLTGPRTFTIREVRKSGSAEQPVDIILAEFPEGRPFKPSKTVRRILVAAWGAEAANYAGHRMTLYRDPTVRFGGLDVGGIRVSHLSHINQPMTIMLSITRGKRAPYRVNPLPNDAPTVPAVSTDTLAELGAMFARKGIAKDKQLTAVNWVTGGNATDIETITEAEARKVIDYLSQRPDADTQTAGGDGGEASPPVPEPETAEPQTAVSAGAGDGETIPEPSSSAPGPKPTKITPTQQANIGAELSRLEVKGMDRFPYVGMILQRRDDNPVTSIGTLTSDEADRVIAALRDQS